MSKKIKLPPRIVEEINYLVKHFKFVLLEFDKGYMYMLFEHHKYLDPWKNAPRSKVCKSPLPDKSFLQRGNFMYVSNPIK